MNLNPKLSPEAVEDYIRGLPWTDYTTAGEKALVAGNIHAFVASLTDHDSSPWAKPPAQIELWAYWMRSDDFIGNAIAGITDGDWSHAGLMIYRPDNTADVYEAIFEDNKIDKRYAVPRFTSFLAASPGNRLLLVPLRRDVFGYTDDDVARVIKYAESCVKDVSYARWQLVGMALAQRLGLPVPSSTTKQVCSEFLARCLGSGDEEWNVPTLCDLRDDRHDTYDLCTPDSTKRRMMDILAGYGAFTSLHNRFFAPEFT